MNDVGGGLHLSPPEVELLRQVATTVSNVIIQFLDEIQQQQKNIEDSAAAPTTPSPAEARQAREHVPPPTLPPPEILGAAPQLNQSEGRDAYSSFDIASRSNSLSYGAGSQLTAATFRALLEELTEIPVDALFAVLRMPFDTSSVGSNSWSFNNRESGTRTPPKPTPPLQLPGGSVADRARRPTTVRFANGDASHETEQESERRISDPFHDPFPATDLVTSDNHDDVDDDGGIGGGPVGRSGSWRQRKSVFFTNQLIKDVADDGLKVINGYTILRELGRGKYGKVKLASVGDTNEMRAIKIVHKKHLLERYSNSKDSGSEQEKFAREVAIMKKLKHRNIVRLHEVIDDPDSQKLYLVMDYIERGPIVNLDPATGTCTPLDIEVARGYMKQIVLAVEFLHNQKICHRDIKPDAILLGANGRAYLADFGVSSMFNENGADAFGRAATQTVGSPAFLAPEAYFDLPPNAIGAVEAAMALDVWALGVAFFAIVLGRLPFDTHGTFQEIGERVRNMPIDFEPSLSVACLSPSLPPKSPANLGASVSSLSLGARQMDASFNLSVNDTSSLMGASTTGLSIVEEREQLNGAIALLRFMLDRDATKRPTIRQVRKHPFFGPSPPEPKRSSREASMLGSSATPTRGGGTASPMGQRPSIPANAGGSTAKEEPVPTVDFSYLYGNAQQAVFSVPPNLALAASSAANDLAAARPMQSDSSIDVLMQASIARDDRPGASSAPAGGSDDDAPIPVDGSTGGRSRVFSVNETSSESLPSSAIGHVAGAHEASATPQQRSGSNAPGMALSVSSAVEVDEIDGANASGTSRFKRMKGLSNLSSSSLGSPLNQPAGSDGVPQPQSVSPSTAATVGRMTPRKLRAVHIAPGPSQSAGEGLRHSPPVAPLDLGAMAANTQLSGSASGSPVLSRMLHREHLPAVTMTPPPSSLPALPQLPRLGDGSNSTPASALPQITTGRSSSSLATHQRSRVHQAATHLSQDDIAKALTPATVVQRIDWTGGHHQRRPLRAPIRNSWVQHHAQVDEDPNPDDQS